MKKISNIHARLQKTIFGRLYPSKLQAAEIKAEHGSAVSSESQNEEPKKRVLFMSRQAVVRHVFGPNDVLISISDSGIEPPEFAVPPPAMLALAFNDHVTVYEEKELGWRWLSRADGAKIVEFVLKHTDAPNIIVHCNVGESRSKGAAIAISEITGRAALHVSDSGRITNYKKCDHDFFNRRVYEIILMEHMCLEADAV